MGGHCTRPDSDSANPWLKAPPVTPLWGVKLQLAEGVIIVTHRAQQTIGNYLGKPIFESIEVQEDTYVFDRIARYEGDEFPLDQLSENELLVEPGLIYRHKK